MRLCRFESSGTSEFALEPNDHSLIPLRELARALDETPVSADSIVDFLPGGRFRETVVRWQTALTPELIARLTQPLSQVKRLVPVAAPGKIILLAGNYAQHVEEQGGRAEERSKTFPYLFMKPTTTLTHPGDPIRIPEISPDQIDWEVELGVVIGRLCSRVSEEEALGHVGGYMIVNDISDRGFHPNPNRAVRPKDAFFDWQHGKWHDTFCPMGPAILPADECSDPQNLRLTLQVNGEVEQDGTTAAMVFPVAAIVSFISQFVTLQPGDVISTGTPDGVGKAKGKFLKPGDVVAASIDTIGALENPVI